MNNSTRNKLLGIALIIVAAGLAYWGYDMSSAIGSKLTRSLGGSFSQKEMAAFAGAAVSFVAGVFLILKK